MIEDNEGDNDVTMELAIPEQRDLSTATLDELAAVIRDEYAAAEREYEVAHEHMSRSVQHAIRAGEALLAARGRVAEGGWKRWVKDGPGIDLSHAGMLMRIAHYQDVIPLEAFETRVDAVGRLHEAGWTRVLMFIRGLPPVRPGGWQRHSPETKDEARRLRREGLSYQEIAEIFGISRTVAASWCDAAAARRQREIHVRTQKRRRAARKALAEKQEREELDRLAKAAGGDISEAYRLVRLLCHHLDAAGLSEAYSHATKVEMEISRALRTG